MPSISITLIFHIGKREVYNFLSVDVGVYLPAYEQVTIYYLKDIMRSRKKSKYDTHYNTLMPCLNNDTEQGRQARLGAPLREPHSR